MKRERVEGGTACAETGEVIAPAGATSEEPVRHPPVRGGGRPGTQPGAPTLALCFAHGPGRTHRRQIPTSGLILGRNAQVFDEPFRDPRISASHAPLAQPFASPSSLMTRRSETLKSSVATALRTLRR